MVETKKKKLLTIIIILFSLTIIISGCANSTEDVITASGTIEALEVNISAETGGKITEINTDEGDSIKKGAVLGRLDSTIQALQVQQAEAALRAAAEKAKETQSGNRDQLIGQAVSLVDQMTSLAEGSKAAMDNARENLDRVRTLAGEGGIAHQQLSDAETRYESARAQYEAYVAQKNSAREQLDLLKSGATTETINIMNAGVAQAQANVSIARAQLEKTVLIAPIDGQVSTVNFRQSEYVSPGAPVITLLNPEDLWIKVYISETEIAKVKPGQKAEIFIDAYPDRPFAGKVSFVSAKAEFTPKNLQTKEDRVNMVFAIKVELQDGKEMLKPGLPADVKIMVR